MADNSQSQYFNQQAAALAAQVAQAAAQLEFQRMRFTQLELPQFQSMSSLDKEKLAFAKASEVWTQAFQEASVSGSYQGQPAAQYLLSAAQLTGQFYQPGQLNADQQAQYQTLRARISSAQQQLMTLAPGSPEYATLQTQMATDQAAMAPLQAILQGTDKAPTQTLQAQNQAFSQMATMAGLTGIVPAGAAGPAGEMPPPTSGEMPPPGVSVADWLKARQGGQAGHWVLTPEGAYTLIPGAGPAPGTAPTMAYQQMVAQLTGMFNGTPTPEFTQMLAALTGEYNGKPTQQALQFAKQFGLSEAAVSGMYNGQPTQAAKEFAQQFGLSQAAVTGLYNGEPTQAAKEFTQNLAFQREQAATQAAQFQQTFGLQQTEMENTQANQLLQLAASLRGPRSADQFTKVIGGTPGGLSDILASVMGRYNLPGYQGGTAAPEAVSLQNFMGDTLAAAHGAPGTYTPTTGQWGGAAAVPAYTVNPPGAQAPTNSFNFQPTGDGSHTVYPPGISAPVQAGQISSMTPLSSAHLNQIGAQAMAAQPYVLPAPTQWNAANWNNLGDYRQQRTLSAYEAAGYDANSVLDQFKASLPTTSGPQRAQIAGIV